MHKVQFFNVHKFTQMFQEGQRAFQRGLLKMKKGYSFAANPYKSGTMAYKEWERGFNKAYFAAAGSERK